MFQNAKIKCPEGSRIFEFWRKGFSAELAQLLGGGQSVSFQHCQ